MANQRSDADSYFAGDAKLSFWKEMPGEIAPIALVQ